MSGKYPFECKFFQKACHAVLDDFMSNNGFFSNNDTATGNVIYLRHNGIFFEVIQDTGNLLFPKYSVNLGIGFGDSGIYSSEQAGMPMWFAIENEIGSRKINPYLFETEDQLIELLQRLKVQIIERYAAPLWRDKHSLAILLKEFNEYSVASNSKEKQEIELRAARKVANEFWKGRRFREYLDVLSPFREHLKDSELARLELAREKLGTGQKYSSQ